jgi:hypothetical protein
VRSLVDSLTAHQHSVWVDWQNIDYSAKWWQEICEGIEQAQNFLFIITPDSMNSEYCHKEIQYARQLGKRIVTVIRCHPDEKLLVVSWYKKPWEQTARENWEYLQTIQYLLFRPEDNFNTALDSLFQTISTDPVHVQTHTRLLVWIREWKNSEQNPSFLLRGDDLRNAETWLAAADQKKPVPTSTQRDYIAESRRVEDEAHRRTEQQRRRTHRLQRAAILFGVLTIFAAIMTVIASRSTVHALNTSATVEWQATYFSIEQGRNSTLVAGLGIVPPVITTPIPHALLATVTRVAYLRQREIVVKEFDDVEMVLVPAGCFYIGSMLGGDTVRPVHEICFESPFWIDRYEVTNAQYRRITGDEPPSQFRDEKHPVDNINWFDARTFCEQRNARLPTEAEWEYTARGPDSLLYPWGNVYEADNATSRDNSNAQSAPIGSRSSDESWVGAFDMAGNAWEWVNTAWADYPYDAADGREDTEQEVVNTHRVKRGGAWDQNNPAQLRAFVRWNEEPHTQTNVTGFRCARNTTEEERAEGI